MKKSGKKLIALSLTACMGMSMCGTVFAGSEAETVDPASADNFIVGVKTEGFVDLEGAKTDAIIIEYSKDIKGSSVSLDDYEVMDYAKFLGNPSSNIEVDYDGILGNEGEKVKVYVNSKEATLDEGEIAPESGKYVVIEVNAEYMLSGQNLVYTTSMMGGATQIGEVEAADGTIIKAGTKEEKNYTIEQEWNNWKKVYVDKAVVSDKSTILLPQYGEGSGWTLNYIKDETYKVTNSGDAFQATDCYSEYGNDYPETGGKYSDFELPYSIYVPDQSILDANVGKVALVIHMEHAGSNDSDPMAAITSSKAAAKLSSEQIQKDNPCIVVVPQVEENRRSTNDYDATSEVNTAIWELLDWLMQDSQYAKYIDSSRVYGTGQSMGGMTILQMAAQRDNFFAGIAVIGAQWSNIYDKPYQHDGTAARTPDVDPISFAIEGDQGYGHSKEWYEENFENWYYMISDDNIFVHTCIGDAMSWGEWDDLAAYFELAGGVEIPYTTYDPHSAISDQDAADKALTNHDNTTPGSGINWSTFTSGNHMSTWKYAYNLNYSFEWLFNQTQESENQRGKVEGLNNEYLGRDADGNWIKGSGTKNMNSPQYGMKGKNADYPEGWKPPVTIKCGTAITDDSFDEYFVGDAETAIAELVEAGKISVNGTAIFGDAVDINGGKGLWKNEDGTWNWKTHIMYHGENIESYKEAATAFVIGLSRLVGPEYTISYAYGKAAAIEFTIKDACMAETVTIGDDYATVTICDMDGEYGDGSMNRTNPETIKFPVANIIADSEGNLPASQNMILYWYDEDGWHLQRADSEKVTVTADTKFSDTRINLEYSEPWNRPTQPVKAIGWMGMDNVEMIHWFYDGSDGVYTSVAAHVDGRSDLGKALEIAKANIASLTVSEDGKDVKSGEKWVTKADYDVYSEVIAAAEKVYNQEGLLGTEYDEAFFRLALATGGDGTHYAKGGNAFEDGIGIMNRAKVAEKSKSEDDTMDASKDTSNKGSDGKTKSPNTGDTGNMFLWLALLLVSGGAVTTVTIASKKKKYNK